MTADPADVIAGALQKPPPWPDRPPGPGPGGTPVLNGQDMLWQYLTPFAMPGGPPLARHLAAGVIKALTEAGWVIVPAATPATPTLAQVRRWLFVHRWTGSGGGVAGTLWTPPGGGQPVGVPYDSSDPDLVAGVIGRVAKRLGQADDRIAREMLACDDNV